MVLYVFTRGGSSLKVVILRTDLTSLKARGGKPVKYLLSLHAEVNAIKRLPKNINMRKITLIVVRTKMRMSRPCEKCSAVIKNLGIRKVYYSCEGKLVKLDQK
jgi:deoxycytidylate deaminase